MMRRIYHKPEQRCPRDRGARHLKRRTTRIMRRAWRDHGRHIPRVGYHGYSR